MKILGYVNRFSRGVYRIQKELKENGNGEALFDFSLVTAFRVTENVSKKYLELGFGAEERPRNVQETSKKYRRNSQKTPKKRPRKRPRSNFVGNKRQPVYHTQRIGKSVRLFAWSR